MTYVHLDIETLPALWMTPDQRLRYAYAKVPSNYKKPASIAKWLKDNADEAWRRTSFDPMLGELWMVGWAVDDAEPFIADLRETPDQLGLFASACACRGQVVFVGKSVRSFDLPWLAQYALREGRLNLTSRLLDVLSYPYDKRVQDVGEMWPTKRGSKYAPSLDPMAQWLGVGGKLEGMHGSKVYDAYLAGEGEKVARYCAQDIISTRECWRVLRGDRCPGGTRPAPDLPEIPAEVLDAYGRGQ